MQGRSLSIQPVNQTKTWKAANEFEAMAINEMLQPMFETGEAGDDAPLGGGIGEKQFKPMLVNEIAKNMQQSGGLGLAHEIYNKMMAMQNRK
ncbi:hypothetical protein A0U93_14930 [Neoasaia chiangmaiensis]|uniref:Flagellar protein FlgJ N-terminal domain-containing protein n=2 Tax=Neoasaia chiangmaiensis TaxID=320497 RepID=A0A1U9KUQ9_9PROT|nr:hypothetical protein A0U93_14930 [Neoasaia chiangmaiensis]